MCKKPLKPQLTFYEIASGVTAFSSTRHGGYSQGNHGEFNVNLYCGDDPSDIAENRKALCQLLRISNDRLVMPHQVHATGIAQIGKTFFRLSDEVRTQVLEGIDALGNIKPDARDAVMRDLQAHFRPEFLNRLDETILFKPLTMDNIGHIVDLQMKDLNRRLADKDLTISLSELAKSYIIEHSYDPVYGARPLKRFIQKNVETLAARLILSGNVGEGENIEINVQGGNLVASTVKPA